MKPARLNQFLLPAVCHWDGRRRPPDYTANNLDLTLHVHAARVSNLPSASPPASVFSPNKFSAAPPITSSYFLSGTPLRKQSEPRVTRAELPAAHTARGREGRLEGEAETGRRTHLHTLPEQTFAVWYQLQAAKQQTFKHSKTKVGSCHKHLSLRFFPTNVQRRGYQVRVRLTGKLVSSHLEQKVSLLHHFFSHFYHGSRWACGLPRSATFCREMSSESGWRRENTDGCDCARLWFSPHFFLSRSLSLDGLNQHFNRKFSRELWGEANLAWMGHFVVGGSSPEPWSVKPWRRALQHEHDSDSSFDRPVWSVCKQRRKLVLVETGCGYGAKKKKGKHLSQMNV